MAVSKNGNPTRLWSLDNEIKLFNLICDYKPAGKEKHKHMVSIIDKINKDLEQNEIPFTASDIWSKLESLYSLVRLDKIEDLSDFNENEEEDEEIDHADHKTAPAKEIFQAKESIGSTRNQESTPKKFSKGNDDLDSSDLSDVETELAPENNIVSKVEESPVFEEKSKTKAEDSGYTKGRNKQSSSHTKTSNIDNDESVASVTFEKDDNSNDEQDEDEDSNIDRGDEKETPKRVTRGARKQSIAEKATTPIPKKRTRSFAKLDQTEVSDMPKRKQTKAFSPAPPSVAKRRTRSEMSHDSNDRSDHESESAVESAIEGADNNATDNNVAQEEASDAEEKEPSGIKNDSESDSEAQDKDKDKGQSRPTTRRSTRSSVPSTAKIPPPVRRSSRKK